MPSSDHAVVRRGLAAILTALLVASGPSARAQPASKAPSRVVLFAPATSGPLLSRVAAELRSLGFEVVSVTESDEEAVKSLPQLEAVAQSSDALAAVRVIPADGAVDLWIVNARTHEMVVRRVVAAEPAVAALRAVETLRANLIDLLALAPPPASPNVEAARETVTIPRAGERQQSGRFAFELGLGPAHTNDRTAPSWHALAGFRLMWSAHWGAHAIGVAPLTSSRVTGAEGAAQITFGLLGSGVAWQPLGESWWTPYVGGGLAGALLHSRGVPAPGFTGYSHYILVACPYLWGGARFFQNGPWRIRVSLLAGASVPRPVVVFEDRGAAAWGRPLLIGTLGVDFALP